MPRKSRSLYDELGARKTIYVEDGRPKGKSSFQGGKFMLIGLDTYRLLRELPVPFAAHKVMYWLCEHNYYGNTCSGWTQAEVAQACKIQRTHVSRMLAALEREQLIIMLERGNCLLNPYLWYRGELRNQQEACERWDERQRKRGQIVAPGLVAAK